MATADVEVHTTIDRPRPEVAECCCDPDNVTAWYANIKAAQWETSRPVRLGSQFRFTYEVGRVGACEAVRGALRHGPFAMETTYLWEDAPSGAVWMTLRNRGEPPAFGTLATPILTTAIRRATA
jgi:hypothetical protein